MHVTRTFAALTLALVVARAGAAAAADQTILGRSILLKTPQAADARKVVVKAVEKASPNTIVGNPVQVGAAITIQAFGMTPSLQTHSLPTGTSPITGRPFWTGDAVRGFKYRDSKLENSHVKTVTLKRSASGTFTIKITAVNPTGVVGVFGAVDGSCVSLAVLNGDTYHIQFAAGDGTIKNAPGLYKHSKPVTQGVCPSVSTTTTTTLPSCTDLLENGAETDVDCGGGTCPRCAPGGGCVLNSDCTSSVCGAFVCQAPTCADGVKNGNETDVDCGGGTCPDCALGKSCGANGDCLSNTCASGHCRCPNTLFTFTVNSNTGGAFDSAEWPGGTQAQSTSTECAVTIQNPNTNIDLVCTLGTPFAVAGVNGFSSCFGTGGEDGDGCQPVSCPPAGVGSCCSGRPSCSAALNGSGSARYFVQCLQ